MKDSLLEKLMQLFDQSLSKRLKKPKQDIMNHNEGNHVENWGDLSSIEKNSCFIKGAQSQSKRILCLQERLKFTKKSHQFIEYLMQLDIIGEKTFELIMNQLLFSDSHFISLNEAKWVVHHTLVDSLDEQQLAFLNMILSLPEDNLAPAKH